MIRKIINPWTWQDKFGFVQANQVTGAKQILYCAGQVSVDENGNLIHGGDMKEQINQIFNNLGNILDRANMQLHDIARIIYYTTDVSRFVETETAQVLSYHLEKGKCRPATSLIGVASLFHPDCVIELEATAVR